MTDSEQQFTIPVVFEVAGTTREQAAGLLHRLLARADRLLTDAAPLADVSDVFYPFEDRWFPEAQLKHIDGNSHADLRLRAFHPFADTYAETPVFDMFAEIFPEEPDPAVFRDENGELDENTYGAAFDDFTEQALDIATYLRRPTDVLAQVERAEQVRDGVAAVLDQHPLPVEPERKDYLVTIAPSYEGEIEGARYAWDYTQWQADFNRIARAREQGLRGLLGHDTPDATSASRRERGALRFGDLSGRGEAHDDLGAQASTAVPAGRRLTRPAQVDTTTDPATGGAMPARSTTPGIPAPAPAPARSSSTERLWTYRVPVEFEVSARSADEARGLVDEGLIGDAPAGTPAAVQQRQRVLDDGDVRGVLGWHHLVDRETPPSPTSRLERGALLSDLLRDRGDQLTEPQVDDAETLTLRRDLRPDSPGR